MISLIYNDLSHGQGFIPPNTARRFRRDPELAGWEERKREFITNLVKSENLDVSFIDH